LPAERVETLGVGPRTDWKPFDIPQFVDTCRREENPRRGVLEPAGSKESRDPLSGRGFSDKL